jgi:hypothetical protein
MRRLPLGIKIVYSVWMMVWIPAYAGYYGPQNFLWLCDLCNLVLWIALWSESRLLFSSQFVSVLLPDTLWMVDAGTALVIGVHPIGGTEYMFDAAIPRAIRALSCFHVLVPALLVWAVHRLGYDRRGVRLQTALTWAVLPLSFWLTGPARNVNWVRGPFGGPQSLIDPRLYLVLCMVLYPVIVYLPVHGAVRIWQRWAVSRPGTRSR